MNVLLTILVVVIACQPTTGQTTLDDVMAKLGELQAKQNEIQATVNGQQTKTDAMKIELDDVKSVIDLLAREHLESAIDDVQFVASDTCASGPPAASLPLTDVAGVPEVSGKAHCSLYCRDLDGCKGVNFLKTATSDGTQCQLFTSTPGSFAATSGCQYYKMTRAFKLANPCADNPCKNGGMCSSIEGQFICTCAAGWAGTICDQACDMNCGGGCSIRGPGHCDWYCQRGYYLAGDYMCVVYSGAPCTSPVNINGTWGLITSKNYPLVYDNSLNCQWLITAPTSDLVVRLEFSHFCTEGADHLKIYDGSSSSAPLIVDLAGLTYVNTPPAGYTTTQKNMFIQFTTDGSIVYSGFNATFRAIAPGGESSGNPAARPHIITSSTSYVTSPGYPAIYANALAWNQLLESTRRVVALTFYYFYTELCCDKLRLYDGCNTGAPLIAMLSGAVNTPVTYRSTQACMYLTFNSDSGVNYQGFHAVYVYAP